MATDTTTASVSSSISTPESVPAAATSSPGSPNVTFVEDARTCAGSSGTTIRKIAKANGVAIQTGTAAWANCRGLGVCGTCRVNIDPAANVSAPNFWERFTLGKDCGKQRLACQAKITGDISVKLKPARDYSEIYRTVLVQSSMIGAFSLLMLGFLVVMLLDIVGSR